MSKELGTVQKYFKSFMGSGYGVPANEDRAIKELIESHKRQRDIIGDDTIKRQKYTRFQWWLVRTFKLY